MARSNLKIYFFLTLTFFLLLTKSGMAVNGVGITDIYYDQVQDTVEIDTTGPLPYPFNDQPAFGPPAPDSTKLYLNKPSNIKYEIEFDPVSGQYVFYEKIGNLNYRLPQTMTIDDYIDYDFNRSIQNYWKERSRIQDLDERSSLIPQLTIGGEAFNRIFGGNTINIVPQGYVEVSFGYQMNTTENPAIPERLRKVPTFDFDEKIQMNVSGQIGTKMNMRVNYNTEATFDYENKMNLEYTGEEDEILKRIEAGNVSLPLNGTLITGASNLFGVKAEMQFGKLSLTTIFSQSKGESQTIQTEGGAQITTFDISAENYDANRHFFLAHYFRDNYDNWLRNTAVPLSPININRIEVWVTNKRSEPENYRNIIAFQDLGEHDPNIYNNIPAFQETTGLPYPQNIYPLNDANGLYYEMANTYNDIRDVKNITAVMSQFGDAFQGGSDFDKIEFARKLEPTEYTINAQLGYISLNSALNTDEVLAVAYNYTTANGNTFQVGEFSTDGVSAPNTLILKLLKGTNLTPKLPTWKLMMKNIYNLNAFQLTNDEFILNIVYQNDSTGTYINYLPEGRIKGNNLLEVLNLDKLNKQGDPYKDGLFDYVRGITIQEDKGRIIFPVTEPFGKHLADSIQDPTLIDKYTFQSLYDSTKVYAVQDAEHNKFKITGSYKGSSSSETQISAFNLAQGSVKVVAGGRELEENVDYTVDYSMGRVKIINQALLDAGTPIQITTESQDMFTMQRKTLMGAYANYAFSDNFNLGATALYMHERPLTQKVDYGEDPISNLVLGMDARYNTQSMLLTKMVDALPFYSTRTPSTINFEAEVARLIPGHAKSIEKSGNAYIDDFEGTKTAINLKNRQAWVLASTPQHQSLFPEANLNNSVEYGINRAKLAFYIIDPLFLRNNTLTPDYIKNNPNLQSNHYVREVYEQELFPFREQPVGQPTNIPVLDLAFYPKERGPYNYDAKPSTYSAGVNPDGTLSAPESRWGGIMRKIESSDFEASNFEFIEFWLMDPFIYDTLDQNSGGDLYFNLGDISEDILKDSRKSFENGLPNSEEITNVDTTIWGRVSTEQSLVIAFDNNPNSRKFQDVGLDGLSDEDEQNYFSQYLNDLQDRVNNNAYQQVFEDPSADNFHYFRGSDYDQQQLGILERYKQYNGPDGNSPTTDMKIESYPTAATTLPDVEDINNDNTLNEYERYYQYHVSLRKEDMVQGSNYINSVRVTPPVKLKNGKTEVIKWYQFKIPIKNPEQSFGNISDFKSIRFMRMFMHGFRDSTVLRFAELDLVRADWRRYTRDLNEEGAMSPNATFDISAVSIEENASQEPVNYILPPGIDRVIDPANPQLRQLNEQSMLLKVTELEQGDSRAAYKAIGLDFRRYKRLKMEVHAEEIEDSPLDDNELYLFIRLGSDYSYNYYEYEIPLKLTPQGFYNGDIENDRYAVWPVQNQLDIPLDLFTDVKLKRNDAMRPAGSTVSMQDIFEIIDEERSELKAQKRVKIKGNPNLGNIEVMMMGIRNKKEQINSGPKSVVVWLNELRLSEFDESGGWAANARLSTRLADLGNVTVAGRTRSAGYGSVSENINSRQLDDINEIDVSASLDFGKFFPEKIGVRLPLYYGYSRSAMNPKYNPLDPDIELSKSLEHAETSHERDSIKSISQDLITRKSITISNAKIEPRKQNDKTHLWDIENFAVSYSYSEVEKSDVNTAYNNDRMQRAMFSYNYNSRPTLIQPFQNVQFLQKWPFKLIGKFNFYPLPTQISFRTDLYRRYHEIQTRNITNPDFIIKPTYEKDFLWNRYFDLRYDLARSLTFDFNSQSTSRIDEPEGRINKNDDDYQWKKDSILNSLLDLGRPTLYNHTVRATYRIPINQIKPLDFISTSSLTYTGNYNWSAGPITADTIRLGNIVQNSNNIRFNGSMNLNTLYNKVPYFREVNQKFRRTGRARGTLARRNSNQQTQQQPEERTFTNNVKLEKDQAQIITHRLNTKKVNVVVTGVEGQVIPVRVEPIDVNTIEIIPQQDASQAMLTVTGKAGDQSFLKDVLDFTTRVLIGVQQITGSYDKGGGTVLPGYLPEPTIFGAGNYSPDPSFGFGNGNSFAPGLPFLFGWQDNNFANKAARNGWVTKDSTLNRAYLFTKSEKITLRTTFEPVPDLRIDITADRTSTRNISEFYSYDNTTNVFNANNRVESGSFSMSTLTWGTAFFAIGKEEVLKSETFDKFRDYRVKISERLAKQRNPNNGYGYNPDAPHPNAPEYHDGYGPNSVEVLVPAFLAAYQGKDPEKVSLDIIPSAKFIRPNWQIRYEGMVSKIPALSRVMRSMNINHSYRSAYNIGRFETSLKYNETDDGFSYTRNDFNTFWPKYDISSVSIIESFSPLINIDITWLSELSTRGEIRRTRSLNLSFANNQLIETLSSEYTLGAGYRFTRMDLIIKTKNSQKAYSNDLNVRADVTYRKNKTVLRKLDDGNAQPTSGQSSFSIKTYAEYMLSDRFQMRVFFDKNINNPFIATSFKTSNTNIGVSFRFTLAQ